MSSQLITGSSLTVCRPLLGEDGIARMMDSDDVHALIGDGVNILTMITVKSPSVFFSPEEMVAQYKLVAESPSKMI